MLKLFSTAKYSATDVCLKLSQCSKKDIIIIENLETMSFTNLVKHEKHKNLTCQLCHDILKSTISKITDPADKVCEYKKVFSTL